MEVRPSDTSLVPHYQEQPCVDSVPSDCLAQPPADPFSSNYPRRIVPSPRPSRGKFAVGILIGLLAGLVLFGSGGFFAAKMTTGNESGESPPVRVSASSSLLLYERSQLEINRTKVTGNLIPFSQMWLPYLSGCSNNTDRSGPKLNSSEVSRVLCHRGDATVVFIEFRSIADRDKFRTGVMSQNIDARTLTPGASAPLQNYEGKKGYYIEYAIKSSKDSNSRMVAGIWWDSADEPVGGYIMTSWVEGLGSTWEPLRDLWRHPR